MKAKVFYRPSKGFTLIELLVVIGIIGILSTFVLMAVGSAKAKGRDAQRESDLHNIQTALELYHSKYGTYKVFDYTTNTNTGWMGSGAGYFAISGNAYTAVSVSEALYNEGMIGKKIVDDPLKDPAYQYMIYLCKNDQQYSVSAKKEYPSPADIARIQTTCNSTGINGTYTKYGKNYAVGN